MITLLCAAALLAAGPPGAPPEDPAYPATDILPILSYDTDVGFGYGVKLFAVGHLGARESFDLVLFNSTKGERWYRLVFSLPDFELRQGTVYASALDVVIDYDKWIHNNFFGVGNEAPFDAREIYTREPLEVSVLASRGFSPRLVGQAGLRSLVVRNSAFESGSALARLPPSENAGRASSLSLVVSVRHDSRDSYIDPSAGLVLQADLEAAPRFGWTTTAFTRFGGTAQWYTPLPDTAAVVAARFTGQVLSGDEIPVQMLLPVGGNRTVRGLVQDRYLDKVSGVVNVELRFRIWWRFGGIAGLDAGKVWSSVGKVDFLRWAVSPVAGLRFRMDTFVVRLDAGFGRETTGLYLNFGQMF